MIEVYLNKKALDEEFRAVGVFSDEGPPVPIPNTAVKLISAENTWLEATREDKAMPTQNNRFRTPKAV